jgi:hypothetical protein
MQVGMKWASAMLLAAAGFGLSSCKDNADADGDGKVSTSERTVEMRRDGYLAMTPGRWQTSVVFNEIDVPKLATAQKQQIIEAAGKETLHYSCLSKAEAAKPGPDFFGGPGSENCTYKRFDLAGNKADMAITCQMGTTGKTDMELVGRIDTADFTFDAKVIVHVPMIGKSKPITMTGTMTGKNMGACQGDE